PRVPPTHPTHSGTGHHPRRWLGFPIRTSSDPRPFIGSPRLIADFHVLHRLLMPRHPPCALTHSPPIRVSSMCARNVSNTLVFDDKKITLHKQHSIVLLMLASTIRFSNHYQTPPRNQQHQLPAPDRVGPVGSNHTHTGFVIPGPNNVFVITNRITRGVKAQTMTALVG